MVWVGGRGGEGGSRGAVTRGCGMVRVDEGVVGMGAGGVVLGSVALGG